MDKNKAVLNLFVSVALVDNDYGEDEYAVVREYLASEEGCDPEVDVAKEVSDIDSLRHGDFLTLFIESASFFLGKVDLQKRLHNAIFQMVFVDQSISPGEKMLYGFLSSYWGMRG